LTTTAPLHIGSGDVVTFDHASLKANGKPNDIQAIVVDARGNPCIPGTALKGVLRSWAEQMLTSQDDALNRIFGSREIEKEKVESGWAEFCTAFVKPPSSNDLTRFADHLPYWNPDRLTAILSHVCIDRCTGTAAHNKLFYEEFVPQGVAFNIEINATRLTEDEIKLLLAILEQGAAHATHPYQFGANGADGWGRMNWSLGKVMCCDAIPKSVTAVGFACCTTDKTNRVTPATITPHVPQHIAFDLELEVKGPFLVNDASRAKEKGSEATDKTNFTPLRDATGKVWLPASSLRGALRERAEFILRSLDPNATGDPNRPAGDGPIERIFGKTSQAARLRITEPTQLGSPACRKQDFVAIDRFTGGAADGAKFDATYAHAPQFKNQLVLDVATLQPEDLALLRLAIDDVCQGMVPLGFGGAKGYGEVKGELTNAGAHGVDFRWNVPPSLFGKLLDQEGQTWIRHRLSSCQTAAALQTSNSPVISAPSIKVYAGDLSVNPTKKGFDYSLFYSDEKKNSKSVKVHENEVHESLRGRSATRVAVEFEMEKGKQVRVLPKGEPRGMNTAQPLQQPKDDEFAHSYYLIRMAERGNLAGDLKDAKPVGHRRWQPGLYSGKLRVRLIVKTPLLICDDQNREARSVKDHFTFPVLKDSHGEPLLASSSVRGVLRSAYEAITNSRFGVFPGKLPTDSEPAEKHGRRLGFRLPAQIQTVPARVIADASIPTGLAIELLPGSNCSGDTLAAAWLRAYAGTTPSNPAAITLTHRMEVWAYLTPWRYSRTTRKGQTISFNFWNVEEVQPAPPGSTKPTTSPTQSMCSSRNAQRDTWGAPDWHRGYVCITQNNMQGKHDERFFFTDATKPSATELTLENIWQWRQLVEDYHDQHAAELKQGKTAPPPLRSPNAFSRHVSIAPPTLNESEKVLKEHDLCYAEIETVNGQDVVNALYPVTISRKLYAKSPLDLLPESLQPAASLDELSPADRVFGWVNQDDSKAKGEANAAYRSQLRIGPVRCTTAADKAITEFTDPKTLAILGQPKPQQGRFYLGDQDGKAQPAGRTKEQSGYTNGNRIRGPKVYPHHANWDKAQSQAFSNEKSNQNRSIAGWVNPGTEFSFHLHITNLSGVELGALVWLLSLPEDHYLRLGLGKPLGFGSVRVEIDTTQTLVADGSEWITSLATHNHEMQQADLSQLQQQFEAAINGANPELLTAFKVAASGFGNAPIHYPLTTDQSPGSGEAYRWFVANEQESRRDVLPDLTPRSSPFLQKHPPPLT
jgi:CRISPR-associated protein (TIGR03986 family)